jgi:menaquinone-9 beta-reductase
MVHTLIQDFDIIIIGGGIAGCATAILYGKLGFKVGVFEAHGDINAWKAHCSHFILPGSQPILREIGIWDTLLAAGAVQNHLALWSCGGWIVSNKRTHPDYQHLNVTRKTLDPMVRHQAMNTPNVSFYFKSQLKSLLRADQRINGVEIQQDSQQIRATARLVIGADGRYSTLAQLAKTKIRTWKNERFFVIQDFLDVQVQDRYPRTRAWILEPEVAYYFPNENGLTTLGVTASKQDWPSYKANWRQGLLNLISKCPDAPNLNKARPVGPPRVMFDLPNILRTEHERGFALLGDAKLANDPIFGVGITWALQHAQRFVRDTAAFLTPETPIAELDAAVVRTQQARWREILTDELHIFDFSHARKLKWYERLLIEAATRHPSHAEAFHNYIARASGPVTWFTHNIASALFSRLSNKKGPLLPHLEADLKSIEADHDQTSRSA